ncbi:unnamed protein product [Calypogeia fissa]
MGTFCCSSSSVLLLGAVPSSISSSSLLSSSNNYNSLNPKSRNYAVLIRRRRGSTDSESKLWTGCRGSRRITARFEAEPSVPSAARSRNEDHSSSAQDEQTGVCHGVSKFRIAGLAATALLANTVCGSALAAAVEASTNENSNFMFVVICVGEAIALTGAAVGGVLARQRKVELERINAQLRQINVNLRRQSRLETYAPNLTYAPVGSGRLADLQVRSDPLRDDMMLALKTGKRYLREQNPVSAYEEFQKGFVLAQKLKDSAEEKKAARGLGASCQRQGKYKEAIKHHLLVLDISKRTGENCGDTEAYGAIADCYTELGDLETAGKYYDRYIERLETDDTL